MHACMALPILQQAGMIDGQEITPEINAPPHTVEYSLYIYYIGSIIQISNHKQYCNVRLN